MEAAMKMKNSLTNGSLLPVGLVECGKQVTIVKIQGRDKVRTFLASLGFVEGTHLTVISEVAGNIIFKVKDARIALGKEMAMRILVN